MTFKISIPAAVLFISLTFLQSSSLLAQSGFQVDLFADDVECFGDLTGNVKAIPSGGTAPYSFLWNTGDTTQSVGGLGAGVYSLTITDATGAGISDSIEVTEPAELTGIVVFGNPTCPGVDDGQASALPQGGTPPYTYQWSDPQMQTTKIATGLASGFYFVTVTDANLCAVVLFVALYDKTVLDPVLVGTDVGCLGNDGSAAVDTVIGGFFPYTYFWNTGDTSLQINTLSPGLYAVTVTDSLGCTGSDSIVVGIDTLFDVQVVAPALLCGADSGEVTIIMAGASPYWIVLNSGLEDTLVSELDTFILSGIGPGDDTITVIDSRLCAKSVAFSVQETDELAIEVAIAPDTCAKQTGTITVTPIDSSGEYIYIWTPQVADSALATGLPAGIYSVTITDTLTGCSVDTTVNVPEINPLVLLAAVDSAFCGDSTGAAHLSVVGGSGMYTYNWMPSVSDSASADGLAPGVYSIVVSDTVTGCSADTVLVIPESNPLVINAEVDSANCPGVLDGSIALSISGGTAPYDVLWSVDTLLGNFVSGLDAGTYGVTITDAQGCRRDTQLVVAYRDTLSLQIQVASVACFGENSGAISLEVEGGTGPYLFSWSTGDTLNGLDSLPGGQYSVTVSDVNGCSVQEVVTVSENDQLSIDADFSAEGCGDFPEGRIEVSVLGGVSPYSYEWSVPGAPDSSVLQGLEAGVYALTVTDSLGCMDSAVFTIVESQQPVADFLAEYDPCARDSIVLFLSDNSTQPGGLMLSWQWFVNDSLASLDSAWSLTVLTLTNVDVVLVVTNADGCSDTLSKSFLLAPIAVNLKDSLFICPGDTIQLNTGATPSYAYSWSPANTLNDSGAPNPSAFPEVTTTYVVEITAIQGADTCLLNDSVIVVVPDSFDLTGPLDTVICDAWVGLSASSDGLVEFLWTSSAGDTLATGPGVVVTPTDTTLIFVTATDQFGCQLVDSVEVIEGKVDIDLDSAFYFCLGESNEIEVLNLDQFDTLDFQWSPPGLFSPDTLSFVTFFADSAGTFPIAVAAENQYGCVDSAQANVVVIDSAVGGEGLYYGQCEPLEVLFVNPGAPNYILFFGDPTNPDASSAAEQSSHIYPDTGIYTAYLVLDPGLGTLCQDTVFFEVLVQDGPFLFPDFNFSGGACSDTVALFFEDQSTHIQDSIIEWEWIFNDQDTVISTRNPVYTAATSPLVVTLNIATLLGCSGTVSDTLDIPFVTIDLPDTLLICRGDTIELNPGGGNPDYTWSWSPSVGLSDSTLANPLAFPNQTTTYTAEVLSVNLTDTCRIEQTVTVIVRENPQLAMPDDVTICDDIEILLTPITTGPIQLQWALDPDFMVIVSTDTALLANPGQGEVQKYYLSATDTAGCETIDSVEVANYTTAIVAPDSLLICLGDTLWIEALNLIPNDTLSFLWQANGSILSALDSSALLVAPLSTQSYIVSALNQFGCSSADTVVVIVDDLSLNLLAFADPGVIDFGGTSQLDVSGGGGAGTLYLWQPPEDLDFANIRNPVASPDSTTTFTVAVIDENGCTGTAAVTVTVELPPCDDPYVFLPNAFTPNNDGINDVLFVRGELIDEVRLEIYNRWGQLVFQTTDPAIGWDGTFKGQPAPQDVYGFILEVNCFGGEEYKKQGNVSLFR